MIPKEQLAAWRAVTAAATEGPWSNRIGVGPCDYIVKAERSDDAAFIATARTAVPALLDEVERLRALVQVSPEDIIAVTEHNAYLERGFSEAIAKLKAGAVVRGSHCEWCGESWPKLDGCTVAEVEANARRHLDSCTKHPLKAERDALRAEVDRLTSCLAKANANHEEFERKWYLATDETDRLREKVSDMRSEAVRAKERATAERDALRSEVERLTKYQATLDEEYRTMKDVLRAEFQACQRVRPVYEAAKEWRRAPHVYDANCSAGDCDDCPARLAEQRLEGVIDAALAAEKGCES